MNTVLTLLVITSTTLGQSPGQQHRHYKLIDLGTFGGPKSSLSLPSSLVLNMRGVLAGQADTSMPDPFAPNCFGDCFVSRGFKWHRGILEELASLNDGVSNNAVGINQRGQIVGLSENGNIDPLTGWPQADAVLWRSNGKIVDLGTLGGNQSLANAINDSGQVVGAALNTTPDPFSGAGFLLSPAATQVHAFLWQAGVMQDLGTLGGPDSTAWTVNRRGDIAGESFTASTPNPVTTWCGTNVPTEEPFIIEKHGKGMTSLGTLGGTCGNTWWLNNRGQVVGLSYLAGDNVAHPFLWTKNGGMQDLGTLGGTFGHPDWINEAGEVVGFSYLQGDQTGHAFLWRDAAMTDLGTVAGDPYSEAYSINLLGQVVGTSGILGVGDLHGFLWEKGGPIVDLNRLVLPGASLFVTDGVNINDRGEVGCLGTLPNGDTRACMLIPCDENHSGLEECDYSLVDATGAPSGPPQMRPASCKTLLATPGQ